MDSDYLSRMRHSAAHVMADAVTQLYPGTRLAIGPAIDNGFYYDFDLPQPISADDLPAIENRMRQIIAADEPFVRSEIAPEAAVNVFKDEPYKLALIEGIVAGKGGEHGEEDGQNGHKGHDQAAAVQLSTYRHGGFLDLCRGPHVQSTGKIGAFKLVSIAGAYWRGDERNKMLTRIYGVAFPTQQELDDYLWRMQEAEKRDHRKLGKELDLFSTSQELGGGLVLWHPKGGLVRYLAEEFCKKEHLANGYDLVYSPHIGRAGLWETSGHLDYYKENMYSPMDIDEQDYYVKPMNCPFHILIYQSDLRSYRDLPLRFAEWGTVYRYERAGVLHGLMRVRGFTQDDAHIFCRPDQMEEELSRTLAFCLHILRSFGFSEFSAYLATRPEKSAGGREAGSDEQWQAATESLRLALERAALEYHLDEGGGAFYGPKIDLKIKDAIGREWQCSTIQFDFNEPKRFGMTYIGEDGQEHEPYMIHRALLGSMERFFGVLIEHYGGAFPLWLAPVQAMLIPIADRHVPYAQEVATKLQAAGLRVKVDGRGERMNTKIRDAQLQKVPYMLVVGDKEQQAGAVAVRLRTEQNLGAMPLQDFVERAQKFVASHGNEL